MPAYNPQDHIGMTPDSFAYGPPFPYCMQHGHSTPCPMCAFAQFASQPTLGGVTKMNPATEPKRISQVDDQLSHLMAAANALNESARVLINRLTPVTRVLPTAPGSALAGNCPPDAQPALVDVAHSIRCSVATINETRELLDGQRELLEV